MLESESCANPSSLCRDRDIFTSASFNTRVKAASASAADGVGERFHPFLNPTKSQSIRLYSSLCVWDRIQSFVHFHGSITKEVYITPAVITGFKEVKFQSGQVRISADRGHSCNVLNISDINLTKGCEDMATRIKPFSVSVEAFRNYSLTVVI